MAAPFRYVLCGMLGERHTGKLEASPGASVPDVAFEGEGTSMTYQDLKPELDIIERKSSHPSDEHKTCTCTCCHCSHCTKK